MYVSLESIDMEKTTQLARESKTAIDIGLAKEARHGVIEILKSIM